MKRSKAISISVITASTLICLLQANAAAQTDAGHDPTYVESDAPPAASSELMIPVEVPLRHTSLVFTVADVVLFSYSDDSYFELYDANENLIWNNGGAPLNTGGHARVTVATGVYKVQGSQKFAVLTGDPITRLVSGYYAMDQDGFGTSTELYTWVPGLYGHCEFIVFAYEDNTDVTVAYSNTGVELASFSLDAGEHWNISNLDREWLHVTANKPVSALTAYDQGYHVPSATGRWSGTLFYTYIGDVQSWAEDLVVMAFNDGTVVTVEDSGTGVILWSGTLNSGMTQTLSYPSGANKYVTILSSDTVTVAVAPWVSWSSSYHHGAYMQDVSGSGIGDDFIGGTLNGGYLHIFSYTDNNTVSIYNSHTGVHVATYALDRGEHVNANPGHGMWRIVSDGTVGAYSGWGQFNAEFAPVEFGDVFNPLNLSKVHALPHGTASAGDVYTYAILFDNEDNTTSVHNVTLVDDLPPELAFFDVSHGGSYHEASHSVHWNIGDLAGGSSQRSVELMVRVSPDTLHGTVMTNYATISSDETPPTTRSVDVITSELSRLAPRIEIGSTRAFLEWGAFGTSGVYRYKIHIWENLFGLWQSPRVIEEFEGEHIYDTHAIIEDLYPYFGEYAFGVSAVDNDGNEIGALANLTQDEIDDILDRTSGQRLARGTTDYREDIDVPVATIVLVPGVGSDIDEDESFEKIKGVFRELGWDIAPQATVEYAPDTYVLYTSPQPADVRWEDPASEVQDVFTFVPYVPSPSDPSQHEIGIAQKGIELGYFLDHLRTFYAKDSFQLISHSLGGLTCRAYIQRVAQPSSYENDVVRLITTGTPHNGVVADNHDYVQAGLKSILLEGYTRTEDAWRLHGFTQIQGWETDEVLTYFQDFIDVLEDGAWWGIYSGGWDFEGQTLMEDVLHNSPFLHAINVADADGVFSTLPAMQYVAMVGEVNAFGRNWGPRHPRYGPKWGGHNSFLGYADGDQDQDYSDGDSDGSIFDGGDGVVSSQSQDLSEVTERNVRILRRRKDHLAEGGDHIGMLMGLGYPVLSIEAASPVDIRVTGPDGRSIGKRETAMFLASYVETYVDGSDTPHDIVEIPFPQEGAYSVEVIPHSDALPTDTFTLIATLGDETSILAEDAPVGDIPEEGFVVDVVLDSDGDGVNDDVDDCPDSDLNVAIVIDDCDSDVENLLFEDGCTMADLIIECSEGAELHGEYVSCVAHLTNDWRDERLIGGSEKGSIQSCAAQPSPCETDADCFTDQACHDGHCLGPDDEEDDDDPMNEKAAGQVTPDQEDISYDDVRPSAGSCGILGTGFLCVTLLLLVGLTRVRSRSKMGR